MTMMLAHQRISPTAKLVAYWRQFTDIPFAEDVANLFDVVHIYTDLLKGPEDRYFKHEIMAPILEVRYKSIQNALEKRNMKQVLEFASGISLRGLAMTRDPALIYVETDLPGLNEEKLKLINIIKNRHNIGHRPNLFFYPVNILNFDEIEPSLQNLDRKRPLAIVHEGLFQYLTRQEKTVAAKNIHKILEIFGGIWITPDLDTEKSLHARLFEPKQLEQFVAAIKQHTGRNFHENTFKDDEDVYGFFNELGFETAHAPQFGDDIVLSSLKGQPMPEDMHEALASLRLWTLTIKNRSV